MRFVLLIGLAILVAGVSASGSEDRDPYWIDLVRSELSMRTSEMTVQTSFAEKNLPRLGDCAGIALLKLVDMNAEIPTNVVKASLSIIRDAFVAPELIAVKADREPKVTLCLLSVFAQKAGNKDLLAEVQKTREYVQRAHR